MPIYRLIDITDNLAVCPCPGMVVKRLDDRHCALFTPGQSATSEGFLLDRPWEDVVAELNDELERAAEEAGYFDGEGEGEGDEDGEGDKDNVAEEEEEEEEEEEKEEDDDDENEENE